MKSAKALARQKHTPIEICTRAASASRRQIRSRTLALVPDTRTMRFHANHASSSVSGDYYQVMFEAEEHTNDPDSPYLLIQQQFETSDGGRCYIETHDEKYIGHFLCAVSSSRRRGCQLSWTARATILSALALAWQPRTSSKHHR